jgi:radical SAM superfamily enzyme YgiQ (UPF0313 family)
MRILFIYPNVTRQKMPQLGICSLAAVARQFTDECDMYDLTVIPRGQEIDALRSKVKAFEPDILAVSCRSNELNFINRLFRAVNLKKPIKIFGGPHATVAPDDLGELADIVVLGEGEETFAEILEKIDRGQEIAAIKGCWVNRKRTTMKNGLRNLIPDLDLLPMPYWRIFDGIHYYNCYVRHLFKGAKVVGTFEASRGCPYACTYCSNDYFRRLYHNNKKWRREKSPERIVREIQAFRRDYGLDCVCWIDEIFLTNTERLRRFSELYRSEIGKPFLFMERPENMTDEKVRLIKQAGAQWVSIGIESGNERIRRDLLNRHYPNRTIVDAFQTARRHRLKTHAFTMIGFPGEDRNAIFETYSMLRETRPTTAQTTIFFPLKGTALYEKVVADGLLNPATCVLSTYYEGSSLSFPVEKKRALLRDQLLLVNYDLISPRLFVRAENNRLIFAGLKVIDRCRRYYRMFREVGFQYALRAIWRRILLRFRRGKIQII